MKILVTGDRNWTNYILILSTLFDFMPGFSTVYGDSVTIIHGDCQGADRLADKAAKALGYDVVPYPAEWNKFRKLGNVKAAGPARNLKMIQMGNPDLVIAFHNNLERSKGTKNMLLLAAEHKIPHIIVKE